MVVLKKILRGRGQLHFGLKHFTVNAKFTSTLFFVATVSLQGV